MSDTPTRDQNKFIVRMPDGLRERIKSVATMNNRSMNAEIISTLEDAYPEESSIEGLMEYMKALADDYKDPKSRSAGVLREIYDVLDGIRSKLREEEELTEDYDPTVISPSTQRDINEIKRVMGVKEEKLATNVDDKPLGGGVVVGGGG